MRTPCSFSTWMLGALLDRRTSNVLTCDAILPAVTRTPENLDDLHIDASGFVL